MNQTAWQTAAEAELGEPIGELVTISGGDFAVSYSGTLLCGREIFIKTHSNPPPGFFVTEATGLQWLRDTETVNIPRVLAVADSPPYLAMEWVRQGAGKSDTEQQLGWQLAEMHSRSQTMFGRSDCATTGSLAVPNAPCERWSVFYSTQRLLPLMEIAAGRQTLSIADLKAVEKIAGSLETCDVPAEPPALLHGDLWAGNRLVDERGRSWLIDPASHCGHREFDLGMMALFGGFAEDCFAAYHERYPLVAGWQERLPLHQLAPLLVHAIKFGGSYVDAVKSVLKKFA